MCGFLTLRVFPLILNALLTYCVGYCAGAVLVCIRNEGTTVGWQVGWRDFSRRFPVGSRRGVWDFRVIPSGVWVLPGVRG